MNRDDVIDVLSVVAAATRRTVGEVDVDVWQAVRPASLGIRAWPEVPRGEDWKTGVCARLGWGDPRDGWRRVQGAVRTFRDLEPAMIGAVERLVDFVTEPG